MLDLLFFGLFLLTNTFLAKGAVRLAQETNAQRNRAAGEYADVLANALAVRRLGIVPTAINRLVRSRGACMDAISRQQRFHARRWFVLHALFGIVLVITLSTLLQGVPRGTVSPSNIVLVTSALLVLRGHMERTAENYRQPLDLAGQAQQVEQIVPLSCNDNQLRSRASTEAREFARLEVKDVSFSFPESGARIEVPEFDLRRGEWVGISGASGQGKTTFLHIVAGLFEPERGRITWEGEERGPRIMLNSQDGDLFHTTLRENLAPEGTVPESELLQLLDEVGLGQLLARSPAAHDTIVGERGIRLSAGERQRISLIRAHLLEREIYLFDEPTAHLDDRTEALVCEFFERHFRGRTVILVSHRPRLLERCDRLYHFTGGVLQPSLDRKK